MWNKLRKAWFAKPLLPSLLDTFLFEVKRIIVDNPTPASVVDYFH